MDIKKRWLKRVKEPNRVYVVDLVETSFAKLDLEG